MGFNLSPEHGTGINDSVVDGESIEGHPFGTDLPPYFPDVVYASPDGQTEEVFSRAEVPKDQQ